MTIKTAKNSRKFDQMTIVEYPWFHLLLSPRTHPTSQAAAINQNNLWQSLIHISSFENGLNGLWVLFIPSPVIFTLACVESIKTQCEAELLHL